ncbi:MAG: hypothetical protein ACTHJ3_12060 [Pararhizobium sp.]
MNGNGESRSTLVAAAIIFVVAVGGWFVLPPLLRWLATISPWLALLAGAIFVAAFFVVFWLRARHQRARRD